MEYSNEMPINDEAEGVVYIKVEIKTALFSKKKLK